MKQRFPSCNSPDDLLVLILRRLPKLSPRFRNVMNISPFLGRHSPEVQPTSDIQLGKMSCGHHHGVFSHFRGPNRKKQPLPKCRIDLGLLFEGCIRLEERIRNWQLWRFSLVDSPHCGSCSRRNRSSSRRRRSVLLLTESLGLVNLKGSGGLWPRYINKSPHVFRLSSQ